MTYISLLKNMLLQNQRAYELRFLILQSELLVFDIFVLTLKKKMKKVDKIFAYTKFLYYFCRRKK